MHVVAVQSSTRVAFVEHTHDPTYTNATVWWWGVGDDAVARREIRTKENRVERTSSSASCARAARGSHGESSAPLLRHGHAVVVAAGLHHAPPNRQSRRAPAGMHLSQSVGIAPPPCTARCRATATDDSVARGRPLPSKRAQQRQPAHRDCNVRAGACAWRYRKSTPFLTESSVEGRTGEPRRLNVRGAGLSNSLRVRSRRAHPAAT